MKKIAMFSMGTRGDIQPYIFLAQALQERGCAVTLGTHPCWRALVESAGVSFTPIGPDIDIEKEAAVIRGKTKNPAISVLKTMNFVFRIIQGSSKEIYEACAGQDLIVAGHSMMGVTEAEVLHIPTVNVVLQTEMIPQIGKPQTAAEKMIGKLIAKQAAKPFNKIRKLYGLPPVADMGVLTSGNLTLIPISEHVLERNPYWGQQYVLCGYWYREEAAYLPDERLQAFLQAGSKPIILALGAMSFEDQADEKKLDAFVKAFEETGERAIIQGFHKTLQTYRLPDTMLAVGSIPHSYLFRQGKLVIHHCGFGTASASLIYGIPSIPVPHVLDQFGFANTLKNLGVACDPIKGNGLTKADVVRAIQTMNATYAEKHAKVQAISRQLLAENGLQKAADLILGETQHIK
ncbi:MAG: glycosyltransferase [Eubacteriales bacterium]|nr:glycosyltransferase [Eubacteriales bacterium]